MPGTSPSSHAPCSRAAATPCSRSLCFSSCSERWRQVSPPAISEAGASTVRRPRLVGVVHLPPLPGSAQGGGAQTLPAILDRARRDAACYADGGFDAVIVENFGDVPFAKNRVAAH